MSLLALIVDDEAPARAELRFLLERIEDVEVVGEAASVREALALAARLDYDVVFCDISMPELTGIDAAREIMSWPKRPHVVFVTAHQDYAVQAFSVDAFDYLLKPVAEDRLAQTVERLRSALRGTPERAARGELAKVPVTRRGETLLLDHDQVYFMLAEGDYARIATYDERFLSTQSLRELEDALPPALFFRIHRSSIVNLQKVTALEQSLAGPLDRAPLGRRGHAARGRAAPDARAQAAPGAARVRQTGGARRGRRRGRPAVGAVRRRRRHRDRAGPDRARLEGAPRDRDLARGDRRDGRVRHASATRSTTSSCGATPR